MMSVPHQQQQQGRRPPPAGKRAVALRTITQAIFACHLMRVGAAATCGGSLYGNGTFSSPGYPSSYLSYSNCTWILKASYGKVVQLVVKAFYTESNYDPVRIYTSSRLMTSTLVGTYSGSYTKLGPFTLSQEGAVWFTTDGSITQTGFSMTFSSVDPPALFNLAAAVAPYTACGGKLVTSGTWSSPTISGYYPANANCTWNLKATYGQTVSFSVLSIVLESGYDYLYLYNSTTISDAFLVKMYTGTVAAQTVTLTQEGAVVFVSDYSCQATGFSVKFSSVATTRTLTTTTAYTACGGFLTDGGELTSPNYPGEYPMNANCTWSLIAAESSYIILTIAVLSFESNYDYLSVYNCSSSWSCSLTARYTGSLTSADKLVLSVAARVTFTSDGSYQQSGFYASFMSILTLPATTMMTDTNITNQSTVAMDELLTTMMDKGGGVPTYDVLTTGRDVISPTVKMTSPTTQPSTVTTTVGVIVAIVLAWTLAVGGAVILVVLQKRQLGPFKNSKPSNAKVDSLAFSNEGYYVNVTIRPAA